MQDLNRKEEKDNLEEKVHAEESNTVMKNAVEDKNELAEVQEDKLTKVQEESNEELGEKTQEAVKTEPEAEPVEAAANKEGDVNSDAEGVKVHTEASEEAVHQEAEPPAGKTETIAGEAEPPAGEAELIAGEAEPPAGEAEAAGEAEPITEEAAVKGKKNLLFIIAGASITLLFLVYIGFSVFFMNHYYWGTTINGRVYGGMTPAASQSVIIDEIADYTLEIKGREGMTDTLTASEIGMEFVFDDTLNTIAASQSGFKWFLPFFKPHDYELSTEIKVDEEKFREAVKSLDFFQKENIKAPENAYIQETSEKDGYEIVPEYQGTTPKYGVILEDIREAVYAMEASLALEDECYTKAIRTQANAALQDTLSQLNSYQDVEIAYEFGEKEEIIGAETLYKWVSFDNTSVIVDEEAIEAYIEELAKKYDTYGRDRDFKKYNGEVTSLKSGAYGYKIDKDKEKEALIQDILQADSVKREPIYKISGYVRNCENGELVDDIGNTYVEIDLGNQHLYVWQEGQVILESDFVSGKMTRDRVTPPGVFGITYKTRNAVLRGDDYETPVKYWMPFNGNIGMHDASWRGKFGGSIYISGGSHGCINLPTSNAAEIYEIVEQGMPVICYYE